MNKSKIIKLIPLIVLILATIVLLISAITGTIVLMKQHIIGLALLAIAGLVQALNGKTGYQITGVILLIGAFAFAAFTPTIYTFYFRIASLKISFDYFCIATLFIYIFIHRKELPVWISELVNKNGKKPENN